MMRLAACAALLFASLHAIDPARAQVVRLGVELQVNVRTGGAQQLPAIAADDDGDFVVVWFSIGQDGSDAGVFARRYDSTGAARGSEFQVNAYTTDAQFFPVVAADSDGDFVIAWQSMQDGGRVLFRRYTSSGGGGAEIQVSGHTFGQSRAGVGVDGDGDFVVVWESPQDGSGQGVFARRFSSAGAAIGVEFQVNVTTVGSQYNEAMAMNRNGAFVVVWNSIGDGDGQGVFARRFDSAGTGYGEFKANFHTEGGQIDPVVGMSNDGGFVVAWVATDAEGPGIFARRFISAGGALSQDMQLNVNDHDSQLAPAIAVEPDGDFVVAWYSHFQDGDLIGAFARRFNSAGHPLDDELQINAYTLGEQVFPSIAAAGGGDFVVAWESRGQDGELGGVFVRRLRVLARFDVDGDGQVDPLTDGLLTLRYEFGFRGATLVTGAVDLAGCTRCTAPAIEAFLAAQM